MFSFLSTLVSFDFWKKVTDPVEPEPKLDHMASRNKA